MQNPYLKYFLSTLLFSAVVALLGFGVSMAAPDIVYKEFYLILAYFFLITLSFHYGLLTSLKGRPQQFVRYFMGATTFKLLFHAAVVIIYSLLNRAEAIHFILTFFVVYLFFTAYEVRIALKLNSAPAK